MRRWLTALLALTMLVPAMTWCQGRGASVREGEVREEPFWITTPADSLLAESILTGLKGYLGEKGWVPVADLMVMAGKSLEGQAYVAGTLDELPGEHLRIYLTRTDCIIFVETCLALARTASEGGDFRMFADELRQSRYRDGRVEAYADRLHYTTEWARQGEARGVLADVTRVLGGAPLYLPVNYMSSHPEAYPLMDDIEAVRKAEDRINSEPRYYIPKDEVGASLGGIRSGDIICLVTGIEGLDISHVGMALVENGGVRLMHASTGPMKVVSDTRTLQQYLAARGNVIGIQVLRPQ